MPFGKDGRRSSEMGLTMPSKVNVDFLRGLFMGILVPVVKEDFC